MEEIKQPKNLFISFGYEYYMSDPREFSEIDKLINDRRHYIKRAPLTYRNVNYLESVGLFDSKRDKASKWRKFSVKELVYLSIIKEARQYGFKGEQLALLKKSFFEDEFAKGATVAIYFVVLKRSINLIFTMDRMPSFYDDRKVGNLIEKGLKSYLVINLNEVLSEIFPGSGISENYLNIEEFAEKISKKLGYTKKELEIVNMISDKNYKSITIKRIGDLKNNEFVVKKETVKKVEEEEAIDIIKNKGYADIKIIKRDGNIQHIKVEETRKI